MNAWLYADFSFPYDVLRLEGICMNPLNETLHTVSCSRTFSLLKEETWERMEIEVLLQHNAKIFSHLITLVELRK